MCVCEIPMTMMMINGTKMSLNIIHIHCSFVQMDKGIFLGDDNNDDATEVLFHFITFSIASFPCALIAGIFFPSSPFFLPFFFIFIIFLRSSFLCTYHIYMRVNTSRIVWHLRHRMEFSPFLERRSPWKIFSTN